MRYLSLLALIALGGCGDPEGEKTATTTASGGVGNSAGSAGQATGGSGGSGIGAAAGSGGTGAVGAGTYCDAWVARLRECGKLGAGRYAGCADYGDTAEACEVACIQAASCTAIDDFFCGAGDEIFECQGLCIGETAVVCSDGSRFTYDYRCDGIEDCTGGEDEAGCTQTGTVKCRNVDQRIPSTAVCDGAPDCSDSSDEPAGCSATFTCTDGTTLPLLYVCDGFVDCPDESDEASDCATATCE